MKPFRVLITGSRLWEDWPAFNEALSTVELAAAPRPLLVVHGYARQGADAFADAWAYRNGVAVERHPALWRLHGVYNPQAGLARNRHMVSLGADVCLAFFAGPSRGTNHCATLAEEAGIPVHRYGLAT